MKFKLLAVSAALFLTVSEANAEISTFVKSVSDKAVKLPNGMQCFVQSRALFGNGDKSPLSDYFAEGGLGVASEKNAPCTIVVGGTVSTPLDTKNHEYVKPMSVDYLLNHEPYKSQIVNAALQTTTLAQESDEQNKVPHTIGRDVGAIVGSSFGTVIGVGMIGIGSLFDSKKKELPEGVAAIYADLEYKDEQGESHSTDVVVYAASTTKELPVDLVRAAVKRVVSEMQAQPDGQDSAVAFVQTETPAPEVTETQVQPESQDSTGTSAQAEIPTPEVHQ